MTPPKHVPYDHLPAKPHYFKRQKRECEATAQYRVEREYELAVQKIRKRHYDDHVDAELIARQTGITLKFVRDVIAYREGAWIQ